MHSSAILALACRCIARVAVLATLALAASTAAPCARAQSSLRDFEDTGSPAIHGAGIAQASSRLRQLPAWPAGANVDIGIVFHVLLGAAGEGDLGDDVMEQQLAVVNAAFEGTGFRFLLREVRRYPDSPYHAGGCFPTTESGLRMKRELAVDPRQFVNVYWCRLALPYIAGYGTLPNEFPEGDPRHGVVVDDGTVPGSAPPLSLGHTLVHELGHYFGLLHTFQGGCDGTGDDVADTPAESIAGYGCAIGRDTCPQDGDDPVENFMDYSDDTCTNAFTPLQAERMRALAATFRPGLVAPSYGHPPRAHSRHALPAAPVPTAR